MPKALNLCLYIRAMRAKAARTPNFSTWPSFYSRGYHIAKILQGMFLFPSCRNKEAFHPAADPTSDPSWLSEPTPTGPSSLQDLPSWLTIYLPLLATFIILQQYRQHFYNRPLQPHNRIPTPSATPRKAVSTPSGTPSAPPSGSLSGQLIGLLGDALLAAQFFSVAAFWWLERRETTTLGQLLASISAVASGAPVWLRSWLAKLAIDQNILPLGADLNLLGALSRAVYAGPIITVAAVAAERGVHGLHAVLRRLHGVSGGLSQSGGSGIGAQGLVSLVVTLVPPVLLVLGPKSSLLGFMGVLQCGVLGYLLGERRRAVRRVGLAGRGGQDGGGGRWEGFVGGAVWSMVGMQMFFCSGHFCEFAGLQYTAGIVFEPIS